MGVGGELPMFKMRHTLGKTIAPAAVRNWKEAAAAAAAASVVPPN